MGYKPFLNYKTHLTVQLVISTCIFLFGVYIIVSRIIILLDESEEGNFDLSARNVAPILFVALKLFSCFLIYFCYREVPLQANIVENLRILQIKYIFEYMLFGISHDDRLLYLFCMISSNIGFRSSYCIGHVGCTLCS